MDTSYETICAADLSAPKNGYLEFEAHPAIIIPYTPREDTAKIYKIPTLIFASTSVSLKGITAQAINANDIVTIGAIIKITLFA